MNIEKERPDESLGIVMGSFGKPVKLCNTAFSFFFKTNYGGGLFHHKRLADVYNTTVQ